MREVASPADLERWIFGPQDERRFTQDSPVLPEVWLRYGEEPDRPQDLLLTPHQHSSSARLMRALLRCLQEDRAGAEVALNEGYVVARLSFEQLIGCVVPLSPWWQQVWPPRVKGLRPWVRNQLRRSEERAVKGVGRPSTSTKEPGFRSDWLFWYLALLGRIELEREGTEAPVRLTHEEQIAAGAELVADLGRPHRDEPAELWAVNLNRDARTALSKSRLAVKADAAERVFSVKCADLRWAIIDTGIDATHPAFRKRDANGKVVADQWQTRVVATYDFTRLRGIVSGQSGDLSGEQRRDLEHRINTAQAIDWDALKPLLAVPHGEGYGVPGADHGTHIAGIVGGDWRSSDPDMPARSDLVGMCPDIELYDLRVFDEVGRGEEFSIAGALQFVRHLNSHSDLQVIHGANLSLSLDHDLANYAVGRTPICDECERLMGSGVMVVAAAGNEGQAKYLTQGGRQQDGFRTVAITDPGNAEGILTVGSTHRQNPHTYGVSYFSSKGPTGDGRQKPDVVAPGEKISSPTPDGDYKAKDGTSQATAHASGVAAMLMARHPELVGQPAQVKQILCGTATDLGRRREFQGSGLVDALRALQAV
jgi:serine protease AprX